MQRVQDALKAQLTKQNEKLEIELREKVDFHVSIHDIFFIHNIINFLIDFSG